MVIGNNYLFFFLTALLKHCCFLITVYSYWRRKCWIFKTIIVPHCLNSGMTVNESSLVYLSIHYPEGSSNLISLYFVHNKLTRNQNRGCLNTSKATLSIKVTPPKVLLRFLVCTVSKYNQKMTNIGKDVEANKRKMKFSACFFLIKLIRLFNS